MREILVRASCLLLLFLFMTCKVTRENGGSNEDSRERSFVIESSSGFRARISNYGATVTHLFVPDKNNDLRDVVLGYDSLKDYETSVFAKQTYFGCVIGRVANRIAHGEYEWQGHKYYLSKNLGDHQLHGGAEGLNSRFWDVLNISENDLEASIQLMIVSPDGDQGYPGNVKICVKYTLTTNSELILEYWATTDKPTPINLTNHSYFNLSGMSEDKVLNTHQVMVAAEHVLELNSDFLPTGNVTSVNHTIFDLRELQILRKQFDCAFIFKNGGNINRLAARAYSMASGILMDVYTDRPSIQVYTANHFSGETPCKISQSNYNTTRYYKNAGICFETQDYPDAVHHPHFPSIILSPERVYRHKTVYRFSLAL